MLRRKAITAIAVTAVASAAVLGLAPPAYADTYSTLNCAATAINNVSVCILRSNQNSNNLIGELVNGSTTNIYNVGFFQYSTGQNAFNCNNGNYSYTNAHTTSLCSVSFPFNAPQVKVCDTYQYTGSTYYTRCTTLQNSS